MLPTQATIIAQDKRHNALMLNDMKIKICLISIFFISVVGLRAFGQSNVIEAHFKTGYINFNDIFTQKYNEALLSDPFHGCIISVTFAKFSIDTLGNVSDISFYEDKDSPTFTKRLLKEVITSSNGLWVPCTVNGKKSPSKPFILPLIYRLEAGCNLKRAEDKTAEVLSRVLAINNGAGSTGEFNQLTCVFLQPLEMFSQQ